MRLSILICLFVTVAAVFDSKAADSPPTKSFIYKKTKQADLEIVVRYPPAWKETDKRPVIVFFFGGGWTNGTINQFEPQATHLASLGMVAARADYRVKSRHGVSPKECVEDAKSAVRWLRQNSAKLGIDPDRIVVAGGSAGGHIAACTALTPGLEAEGEDIKVSSKPNALILFNPVLRFSGIPELMGRIGNDETLGKAISPTLYLEKNSPPTLIFFGTADRLKVMGDEFMEKSKKLGHRAEMFTAEGQPHSFFNRQPWLERTTQRMDEFLASLGYTEGKSNTKAPVGLLAPPSAAVFPLKPAESGRYLMDQKGEPFLVVGDTAWSLIVQLAEDDIDYYLQDRQKRGFNSIIVNLIEHKFCTNVPNTRAGLAPFTKVGDFSTPNPDYFDFAYKVVKKANDHGIVVWLFPAYLGYGGGDEGFFREMKAGGKAKLHSYGRFVGKRFKDLPNIVWVLGGDFIPGKADQWTASEVAAGISDEDSIHPMSAHGIRSKQVVVGLGNPTWLTVNTTYIDANTLIESTRTEYDRRPIRPFVLIEAIYEGEHNSTPDQVRRQAYLTVLGGASGQFFGNNPIWHFDGPGLYPVKTSWKEALDGPGSRDMARLRDLFVGLAWHRLEPERNHEVVMAGYGQGIATALTARTPDKKLCAHLHSLDWHRIPHNERRLGTIFRAGHRPLVQPDEWTLDDHRPSTAAQPGFPFLPHAGRQREQEQ